MHPTPVILITGHPASGKTTLARSLGKELGLLALCKDDIKEILYDTMGWSDRDIWNRLSVATWELLYHHVTLLLEAHVPHIVESNFNPKFANAHWQRLAQRFDLHLIQVRCEGDPDIQLERYRQRIRQGQRHPGHRDGSDDDTFHTLVYQGPLAWIDVESERLSVDTTQLSTADYGIVAAQLSGMMQAAAGNAGG